MINNGMMEEILMVGVYNTADRINEYTYSYDPTLKEGGKGNQYLDFIEKEVIPLIMSKYRINPLMPRKFGILGSSLGGLISCYAGWTRSHVFERAG
jgi:predicted alpha/beta superfamily hydrolase